MTGKPARSGGIAAAGKAARPTPAQRAYLRRGLDQPGGKLPLFDEHGQRYAAQTIRSCLARGWAAPWFDNPTKPDWLVCRLTPAGRAAVEAAARAPEKNAPPNVRRGNRG